MIDTLKASRTLKKNGFDDNQADAIIEIVSSQEHDLATKADIMLLRKDIDVFRKDIDVLRTDMDANIAVLRGDGRSRDKQIGLIQWLVGISITGTIAILVVLVTAL